MATDSPKRPFPFLGERALWFQQGGARPVALLGRAAVASGPTRRRWRTGNASSSDESAAVGNADLTPYQRTAEQSTSRDSRRSWQRLLCVIIIAGDAGVPPRSRCEPRSVTASSVDARAPRPAHHKTVTQGSQAQNGRASATRRNAPRRTARRNSCAQPLS